ncbi:MAG: CBS domain-containing protein [Gammaproteobacteria bacterium]|nr:CBS domain-containing protein [Gammaproteobacteria bacterium]MDE0271156.1 CBS domain-containing protein [Gammaproteobacteria bacterium]
MNGDVPTRVADLMSADVHSVDGLATVAEAMAVMRRHTISSLVVNRRDSDDEFGLLVVSDIAAQVIAANRAPERMHVYEVMSKPVLTLPSDMQARYATRLLVRLGLSRAIVVDHDRNLLGMATLRDLVLAEGE